MCTVCGCGHAPERETRHDPSCRHVAGEKEHLHFGEGAAGLSVPGMSQARVIRIEQDILGKNKAYAEKNRTRLAEAGAFALNLVSSPGAGKTTLLVETLKRLQAAVPAAVIEGDQQTENDAERIRETGVSAVQINTGKGCHLDAHMVGHALGKVPLEQGGVIFIENVGNLVCPAEFDLGEDARVVVLSVTEGEDKPLKYPDIFAGADLMILTKTDLLPHVDFCVGAAVANARRVNSRIQVLQVSSKTGAGLGAWLAWLAAAPAMRGATGLSGFAAE